MGRLRVVRQFLDQIGSGAGEIHEKSNLPQWLWLWFESEVYISCRWPLFVQFGGMIDHALHIPADKMISEA
jgi:hypothetical protein